MAINIRPYIHGAIFFNGIEFKILKDNEISFPDFTIEPELKRPVIGRPWYRILKEDQVEKKLTITVVAEKDQGDLLKAELRSTCGFVNMRTFNGFDGCVIVESMTSKYNLTWNLYEYELGIIIPPDAIQSPPFVSFLRSCGNLV